jgi:DNA-binding PucR family transcriptional regulator
VHPPRDLRDYDDRCSTDLIDTLAEWCRRGFDVQSTATATHLHSNTLRYRLRRAEEISRIDLRHPRHRLLLQLLVEGEATAISGR